jgi:hypothetical protein
MIKKIGLSVALLAGLFVLSPRPAKAEVHFGVYVGAPAYTYPAYPAYGYDAYPDYYANPAPVYRYPAPAYVTPYYSYGYGSRYYRDREHERHEFREHERHERNEHRFRR